MFDQIQLIGLIPGDGWRAVLETSTDANEYHVTFGERPVLCFAILEPDPIFPQEVPAPQVVALFLDDELRWQTSYGCDRYLTCLAPGQELAQSEFLLEEARYAKFERLVRQEEGANVRLALETLARHGGSLFTEELAELADLSFDQAWHSLTELEGLGEVEAIQQTKESKGHDTGPQCAIETWNLAVAPN